MTTWNICSFLILSLVVPWKSSSFRMFRRLTGSGMRPRLRIAMVEFNTFVRVSSSFKAPCSLESDNSKLSLGDYMRLPVEQYVCIKMPLDATLARADDSRFYLTVPPGIVCVSNQPFDDI